MFFDLNYDGVAIITKSRMYKYNELLSFPFEYKTKQLILILCHSTFETISQYVTAMNSPHAVMLLESSIHPELLHSIITNYEPKWIVGLEYCEGYRFNNNRLELAKEVDYEIHPDLALLLSTSGTTGSQKFVRLSYKNLHSNAKAIQEYLEIHPKERAILNLPLSYSYGMSIVNSHLLAHASIVLTEETVLQKSFWTFVKQVEATSLSGVPFTYQMLQRIDFTKMDLPALRTLTQAGGRLNEKLVQYFGQYALEQNKRFYVMYGQTEAAPRISYIPPENLLNKIGSIGIPIPGGKLRIEDDELIYYGENVMLGYAETREDLSCGDQCLGVLHTGDTAIVDSDGYFTITGRMKRFIKLFGLRINLDDVEKKLEIYFSEPIACVGTDEKMIIIVDSINESKVTDIQKKVEELYHLHKSSFKIKFTEIPYLSNGKINYKQLQKECL